MHLSIKVWKAEVGPSQLPDSQFLTPLGSHQGIFIGKNGVWLVEAIQSYWQQNLFKIWREIYT